MDPFTATRYHSLTILPETLPDVLEATAWTARGERSDGEKTGGVIMAVRHTELPIHGVQFHPESILTEGGHRMLANWLGYCGAAPDEGLVARLERGSRRRGQSGYVTGLADRNVTLRAAPRRYIHNGAVSVTLRSVSDGQDAKLIVIESR